MFRVTTIAIRNGIGNQSSNPGQDCGLFPTNILEKIFSYEPIERLSGKTAILGEGKFWIPTSLQIDFESHHAYDG